VADLPNALLADIAQIIDRFHTRTQIENMFIRLGAPGEPPTGNKMTMGYEWLRRANGDPACDAVALLGGLLEQLMDGEVYPDTDRVEGLRADVRRSLAKHGLSYQRGGMILGATLTTPSRSVEDLIRQGNLPELHKEFDRALANVESDPPAAVTAACAILESLFKVIIADEKLTLPSDHSVLPLWKIVQAHLGAQPGNATDPHVRQIQQGLSSALQGIAGLRSNAGSAHGRGPGAPAVEARHARLAVHAAHTLVVYILESRK
jgi:hypothetical protein